MGKTTKIGRFDVLKPLGEGFHGQVFLCWDPELNRKVALKLITQKQNSETNSATIVEEAKFAAKISHPNVIPIYEASVINNVPVLVFEYVDGMTLKEYLKEHSQIGEREALSIMVRIAVGLQCAHDQGIVHLDLSPNNILIDQQGRPRIMDFGLAQLTASVESEELKKTSVAGTPSYMSPEHVNGKKFTPSSDVFTLGLVFYEMLTGTKAIKKYQLMDVLHSVEHAEIDWGKIQYLKLTPEVVAVLRDMLQKDCDNRYASAAELVPDLDSIISILDNKNNSELALEFLMRRLQRRNEFPACSQKITQLNQVTSENSETDFNQIGEIILQDYALTNRIMKIANSAAFSHGTGNITKISHAISRLGLKLLRMICNCLLLFNQIDEENHDLKDVLLMSFIAGLIAKQITEKTNRKLSEEAFICTLYHRLGYHLLAYYLHDEYDDIKNQVRSGNDVINAERSVLSTTCNTLGAAVAKTWNYPENIINSMKLLPAVKLEAPTNTEDYLSHIASYANELCQIIDFGVDHTSWIIKTEQFIERHKAFQNNNIDDLLEVLNSISEELNELLICLGIDKTKSHFIQSLESFKESMNVDYQPVASQAV